MAESNIVPAGQRPGAGVRVNIYTCPANTRAVLHVSWSNGGTSTDIDISVAPAGAAHANTQFRAEALGVSDNDSGTYRSIAVTAGDVVRVRSTSGNVTFDRSGVESSTVVAVTGLRMREADGAPNVMPVGDVIVPNGSLADNGGGVVTLTFPGISVPTGTGFRHVTAGVEDAAAKLVDTADINADQVTDAKLRNSTAVSVIGRAANSLGDPADIAAGANAQFLSRHSDALAFAAIVAADLPLAPVTEPAQITVNQNDYAPGDASVLISIVRLTSDANRDITGLAGGAGGRIRLLQNANAAAGGTIRLMHENAGSAVANRVIGSGMGTQPMTPGQMILTWYDATDSRWRAVTL